MAISYLDPMGGQVHGGVYEPLIDQDCKDNAILEGDTDV